MADLKKPYNDVKAALVEIDQARKRTIESVDDIYERAVKNAAEVENALAAAMGKTATDLMRDSLMAFSSTFEVGPAEATYAPYLNVGNVRLYLDGRNGQQKNIVLRGDPDGRQVYVREPDTEPKLQPGKYRVLLFVLPVDAK